MRRRQQRAGGATYREVFAVPEFRPLLIAYVASLAGDRLAQVALSVLVFDRTGSAVLTALTYALTFLPALFGGPLLAGLADRLPRRRVMIASDLARAALVALIALPFLPLGALLGLLLVAEMLSAPFTAARAAMLPDILPGDRYVVGSAIHAVASQGAQVLGFAAGGIAVAALHPRGALLLDAATFLLSAALVRAFIQHRPVAVAAGRRRGRVLGEFLDAGREIFGNKQLRGLACSAWLWTFFVIPEGLAAPYAASLHQRPVAVGLLLAAAPVGTIVGAHALARRVPPANRLALIGPLTLLAGAPLLGFFAHPGLAVSVALLAVSGLGLAYNVPANAAFMTGVAPSKRGQAFGLVMAGMLTGQGLGILVGGSVAQAFSPAVAMTMAGAAGVVTAALLSATWLRRSTLASPAVPAAVSTDPVEGRDAASRGVVASSAR